VNIIASLLTISLFSRVCLAWKKLEEDVKSLSFWKSRAKTLEDTLTKQKVELETLQGQLRLTASKLQTLMMSSSLHGGRAGGGTPLTGSHYSQQPPLTSTTSNAAIGRPSSAPATRGAGKQTGATTTGRPKSALQSLVLTGNNDLSSSSPAAPAPSPSRTNSSPQKQQQQHGDATASVLPSAESANHALLRHKSMNEVNVEEIIRLQKLLKQKDDHILLLSKKLSLARAHPLLNTTYERGVGDDEHQYFSAAATTTARKGITASGFDANEFRREIDVDEDEIHARSPAFDAEEQRLEDQRLAAALRLQDEFNNRIRKNKRSSSSPFKRK
jgi:hypothetical protein